MLFPVLGNLIRLRWPSAGGIGVIVVAVNANVDRNVYKLADVGRDVHEMVSVSYPSRIGVDDSVQHQIVWFSSRELTRNCRSHATVEAMRESKQHASCCVASFRPL